MNKNVATILAFFIFCVPIRSLLVYIAVVNRFVDSGKPGAAETGAADKGAAGTADNASAAVTAVADKLARLQLLAVFTFGMAIYWLFIYFSGLLSDVWWSPYRLIHAVNFLIFSALVYLKYEYAYIILLLDLIFGVTVFILQNYDFISKFVNENIIDYVKRYSVRVS
jgi:hypothetical protein